MSATASHKRRKGARRMLLFVCTGNICRSPMAACLLRARLGDDSGWEVRSAGLMAAGGQPASQAAVEVMARDGLDLRDHRSHPVTAEWVDAATLVVVMTRAHRDRFLSLFPGAADKVYLLRTFDPQAREPDLDDPIGAAVEVYGATGEHIRGALPGLMKYLETFDDNKGAR